MSAQIKSFVEEARRQFASLVALPDGDIDLARGALLIAAEEEPRDDVSVDLYVAHYLTLLDAMGRAAKEAMTAGGDAVSVESFNGWMFETQGFAGDKRNYYNPRNSLLPYVIEKRTGLPITLSVIYMEVGRLAGLTVEGVGLPGHFVVRAQVAGDEWKSNATPILVDPFNAETVDEDACQQRLDTIYGGQVLLSDEHLRPVTTKEILFRMLQNLKGTYAGANLHRQAASIVERILLLAPERHEERRDYGTLLARADKPVEGIAELQAYLQAAPDDGNHEQVRELIKSLCSRVARLN